MAYSKNNQEAFFALLRAGLWGKEPRLSCFSEVDYNVIMNLAEEQSVVGLVTAGLEHVTDVKVPQELLLQFIGQTVQLEQCNKDMNNFIAELIEKLRKAGIYAILVKGQGVAQCYEKPLWRASGDVDLFLSEENYYKAKDYLPNIATNVEQEGKYTKHLGVTIGQWAVELHGSLRCSLSLQMDKVLDKVLEATFYGGEVRSWLNGKTQVFMLREDNDAIYIFSHFLKHFYLEGLGLRQICDWCRLLWTYRTTIDTALLERRLRKMGLMTEWRAFGAYVVDYLGMPAEAMPLYSPDRRWSKKAHRINKFILEVGNMGHNRDASYFHKYPFLIRKCISMSRRVGDLIRHALIFPLDSFRFFPYMMLNGLREAVRGK